MTVGWARPLAILAVLACLPLLYAAESAAPPNQPASELMKRGLYKDAVRVLLAEIQGRPEPECARKFLMLGESYYLLDQYAEARPYFVKARQHLPEGEDRTIAEYRLACTAYRMGDAAGAAEKIDDFLRKYPGDRRAGVLMLFRMKLLAKRGKDATAQIEALHAQIQANLQGFGYAAGVAADKALTDFYVEHGEEEKAKQRYMSIVHGFRNAIAEYARDKRPVPAGLEQAHDHAAVQLGVLNLKGGRLDEAVRWLENVAYDADLKNQARLLLAQVAYQKQDFDKAAQYLTRDGFIEKVPAGPLRSDMYLVLGLCERVRTPPNPARAVEYLEKVEPAAAGYAQARLALADLYREKGLADRAIAAYEAALPSPAYEAQALYYLGTLYLEKGDQEAVPAKQKECYRTSAARLSQLTTKYPTSRLAKMARESIDVLIGKGFDAGFALSDDQMVRRWDDLIRKQAGSADAARTLVNLARLHAKAILDDKGERFVKAPNHAACAAACEKLLDGKTYTGKDLAPDQWKGLQAEALYYRAQSHLASFNPPREAAGPITPAYLKKPDLAGAIQDFTRAKELVDPAQLDLVKGIELGLLEAMFKSNVPEHLEKARARFVELVNEYGTDARFQQLAVNLAEWYREQGRYADAAREYKGIAARGTTLAADARLKAFFQAGRLFSRAAQEAREKPGQAGYGIYIYPKEVLKLPDFLETYPPLRQPIQVQWPARRPTISGEEALALVSEASGIPFVWSPDRGPDSVAEYLKQKRVRLDRLGGTVEEFLRQILDFDHHRLAPDIGITGGTPTIAPKAADDQDPEHARAVQTLEIYDRRRPVRYKPLLRDYGSWRRAHNGTAMLFNVVERIEATTGTKVLWAEGVQKGDVLGVEYKEVPGLATDRTATCAEVLQKLLEPIDLRYKVVPRDLGAELYEEAKDCFNEIRKIDPKSPYGEKSLFLLALNYYRQEDYERMKIVLREYLKVFDSPAHEHYHEACFWVGWAFEHEKRYRDACRYFSRAAEECLVVYKPGPQEKPPTREAVRAALSYETLVALTEPAGGGFENAALDREVADFVRLRSNVTLRVDPGAAGHPAPPGGPAVLGPAGTVRLAPFAKVAVLDVLFDLLEPPGLALRVENVNREVAEKAYYRLASAYKKDGLMEQALAACHVLLDRFPQTARRRDACKLKLDIYKGLKDYRNVLATLEQLKAELADAGEAYKIDFEMARIYFDLCRYAEAAEHFKRSLAAANHPQERLNIREGYARALLQGGEAAEALRQFEALAGEETEPIRAFIDRMMVWYLALATGRTTSDALPPEASDIIRQYEALKEPQRAQLSALALAKVTWIYYAAALVDLKTGRTSEALEKLEAAARSPDDWLSADAMYRLGVLQMKARRLREAREAFEYLLFSTKSAEAEVKATYALGLCHQELGDPDRAKERFDQLLARFPDSAYAERVKAEREGAVAAPPDAGTAPDGR